MHQHKIHGEVAATREAIGAAVGAASDFAGRCGLSGRDRDRLCVVVEELVTNVVDHGRAGADSTISFAFQAEADAVGISITDSGVPFDPRRLGAGGPGPERTGEGGRGWSIVLSWCRIEDYRREGDRNCLLLKMPAA